MLSRTLEQVIVFKSFKHIEAGIEVLVGILRIELLVGIFRRLLFTIIIIVNLFLTLFLLFKLLHVLRHRNVKLRFDLLITEQVVYVLF